MDGQFCGVIDIWWQAETKNCTAQDAKVARALKFPGTYNAPTFETTASLLRAVLSASSNNSAAVLLSTKSHTLVQITDYQPTRTDNFVFGFESEKITTCTTVSSPSYGLSAESRCSSSCRLQRLIMSLGEKHKRACGNVAVSPLWRHETRNSHSSVAKPVDLPLPTV